MNWWAVKLAVHCIIDVITPGEGKFPGLYAYLQCLNTLGLNDVDLERYGTASSHASNAQKHTTVELESSATQSKLIMLLSGVVCRH